MLFIGQHHIMNVLAIMLPELYKHPEQGVSILLDGPSGYGKTTMAIAICEYLAGKNFEYYLYDRKPFVFEKRVIFIDEVHRMREPEILFPIMDERKHVIILATNHTGGLPEALRNRCREFIFGDYDDEELQLMAMEAATFSTTVENYQRIVEAANRNPRILKNLVDTLGMYFRQKTDINPATADFSQILGEVFQISGGLDTHCRRYLEILGTVGGTASLSLLSNILHIDQETLRNQVEPVLIKRGLVNITTKGRKLV